MSAVLAEKIVEDDDDFNEFGELKSSVAEDYKEKYEDESYLSYNANEDNDFEDVPDESSSDDDDDY